MKGFLRGNDPSLAVCRGSQQSLNCDFSLIIMIFLIMKN